ncbi:hypothetical protein SAMN05216371_0113 [Streptomyces sp. TLI_053]|nr:hypothetical protein SAMN05216371_0113 [Streptomyces sp. TLI_053]
MSVSPIGSVAAGRRHELVASSLRHVEAVSAGCQPVGEDGVPLEEFLRVPVEDIGLSGSTVKTYWWAASR